MSAKVPSIQPKVKKKEWSPEEVVQLIRLYHNSPELWNKERNCNKFVKERALVAFAHTLSTDFASVSRKLHHLRTQFNEEARKIERTAHLPPEQRYISRWSYFNELAFLTQRRNKDASHSQTLPTEEGDSMSFEYIMPEETDSSEQADDKTAIRHSLRLNIEDNEEHPSEEHTSPGSEEQHPETHKRVAPNTPAMGGLAKMRRYHVNGTSPDEYDVFGAYVASELRALRNTENKRQLKVAILRLVCEALEKDSHQENVNHSEN